MVSPLVPGAVDDSDPRNCNLADVLSEKGLGADGAQEGVPAVGHRGRVQESEVQGLEGAGGATGLDALHDGLFLRRGGVGRVGDVGETHFGRGRCCEGFGGEK